MNLICPHNEKIKVEKKFGVVAYLHENGQPCNLLNNYSVNISKIVNNFMKYSKIDLLLSDKKICALSTHQRVVEYFVKTISQCDGIEIACILLYLIAKNRIKLINQLLSVIGNDISEILLRVCVVCGINKNKFEFPARNYRKLCLKIYPMPTNSELLEFFKHKTLHDVQKIIIDIDRRYNK